MIKYILLIIFFFIVTSINASASENFLTSSIIEYKVNKNGITYVTHTISVKNLTSYEYVKEYILEITNSNPEDIKVYEGGSEIPFKFVNDNNKKLIHIPFDTSISGKNKTKTFLITYTEDVITKKSGEVWEINIPKYINSNEDYKIALSVPESFGQEALIYPEPTLLKKENNNYIYNFLGDKLSSNGITAVFGKFQVYSVNLKYNLVNDKNIKKIIEIAIPPDTTTQKVYYTNISPKPINVRVDDDGNWLASFNLQPKTKQEVIVQGYIQVFSDPIRSLSPHPATLLTNLKPSKYWETDDNVIKDLASNLKSVDRIYSFVVNNLTYNKDRIKSDTQRLGAKNVLSQMNNATCTEFTDLFISISRAAGIPAREINGYAYSENLELQPLSLIADVLHSWPEYWDEDKKNWIPVDPTWESTSKSDYFNKFDLKHIAFVIHGKDSTLPLPAGSYKSDNFNKDINVELSSLPLYKNHQISSQISILRKINPFMKKVRIVVNNNGTTAIYFPQSKIIYKDVENILKVPNVIPPYSSYDFEFSLHTGLLASNIPEKITLIFDSDIREFYLNKKLYLLEQILLLMIILIIILCLIGIKTRNFQLKKIINKLTKLINLKYDTKVTKV